MENKIYTHKRSDGKRKEKDITNSTVDGTAAVDKVTCDILSRLPVRSLMRFKLVCKYWLFLVEKDSYFKDSQLTHSKSRRTVFCVGRKHNDGHVFFATADYLSFDEGRDKNVINIVNTRKVDVPYFVSFFGPLNGLIGFYDSEFYSGVCISNVCTHETTPLPKSATVRKYKANKKFLVYEAYCQLGFDSVTKKYKVVCICSVVFSSHNDGIFCEVLTIGDDKWRFCKVPSNVIDCINCIMSSVYVNGSIYYKTVNKTRANDTILAFDIISEKFSSIELPEKFKSIEFPKFSFDPSVPVYNVDLLEMDGRLALLCRVNGCMVKLWLYSDVDEDCKKKNCWSELTVELPYVWDRNRIITFHSAMAKEEILLKSYRCYSGGLEREHSYHMFNWRKKSFKQIEICGIPSSVEYFYDRSEHFKVFTESLLSIN